MPTMQISSDLEMHYLVDDYTDPWTQPQTVLMLHGVAESGAVWYGWVPHLARQYRVVRPDMRGFGASTPMPRDFPWSLDVLVDDYIKLMRSFGIDSFHLVGAKLGGTVARHFAACRPDLVLTLTVAGTRPPKPIAEIAAGPARVKELEAEGGLEQWARRTMSSRLGDRFPEEGAEWWISLMARTALSTQLGFMNTISVADITEDLPRIQCPTLVITTAEGNALGSVEETRAWQRMIPDSRLLVLPGNSYHVAASDADRCGQETLRFITDMVAD